MILRAVIIALALALVALGTQTVRLRLAKAGEATAKAAVTTLTANIATERAQAKADATAQEQSWMQRFAEVNENYERKQKTADAKASAVIADLRAGTIRLRDYWDACRADRADVPQAASSIGQRDDAADLRATGAGNLVRIAARADAQVRACQGILRAERAKVK